MPDGGLTFAQLEESPSQVEAHAHDLPTVHWPGLDEQMVFKLSGAQRPTRCGLFDHTALLGHPLERVTCPRCRELAAADGEGGA